jgi:hypothetical protein
LKSEILARLSEFQAGLKSLKKEINALTTERVSRKSLRDQADALATVWVEDLRSPLEHQFGLPEELIKQTSASMKQLHRLSRPNNLKSSYLKVLNAVLRGYQDRFVLPIKQTTTVIESVFDLQKLVAGLSDAEESDYLREAIDCANAGFHRAAIVLGWCAAVDRMQKKVMASGFDKFNAASTVMKNQGSGKFKRWNKEFVVTTLGELQQVFDSDLIHVLEGLSLLDSNQAQRLETCFQYRNHSAHPGQAPIGETHLVTFFTDATEIVLSNPAFR